MSVQHQAKRISIRDLNLLKSKKQPIVCLTAYNAPLAHLADRHADIILVGDSLGMVLYGFESTLQVTLDLMIAHGRSVVATTANSLVVVDMPFGSYQESPEQAFRNAAIVMAQTGCQAVKLEGGIEMAGTVSFLVERGIPVVGHIGLQPQSVHAEGGYRVTGREEIEKANLIASANAISEAGAFAIVLECMDEALAASISATVDCITIGIGASASCDGQILVTEDLLGLTAGPAPKFVKKYADLSSVIDQSLQQYASEVRVHDFPSEEYLYASPKKKLNLV